MASAEIKELTEKLEQGVRDMFTSDKYKEYLAFMSKFHNYSFNNILLILMQMPDASLVAGYKTWQKMGRNVRKGEHGIRILAPCKHKKVVEKEGEEDTVISFTTFRPASVFDVSQTDGEDLPQGYIKKLEGDVDDYDKLIEKLKNASPAPIRFDPLNGTNANGYYSHTNREIVVKEGMSEQQTVKTLVHEISHAIMHDKESGEAKEADRNTREVQAESVAYTVCGMLGIDTSDYSFGYVAGWSEGKEPKELLASMEVIRRTASKLIEELEAA